jgi:hypothetical protein
MDHPCARQRDHQARPGVTEVLPTPDVTYYDRVRVDSRPAYDANGDGKLWVRTTALAQCTVRTTVALVSQNLMTVPFPTNALTANWFRTGNNGAQKVIVDTRGPFALEAADLALRCNPISGRRLRLLPNRAGVSGHQDRGPGARRADRGRRATRELQAAGAGPGSARTTSPRECART